VIYLALAMLGFGVCDLARWSPDRVGRGRAIAAATSGAVAVAILAALSGIEDRGVIAAAAIALAVLLVWSAFDLLPALAAGPGYAIVLVFAALRSISPAARCSG